MDHVTPVLDLKSVEAQMLATHQTLESFIAKSNEEIKAAGSASAETKAAVDKLAEKATALGDKIAELEQKQAQRFEEKPQVKTIGEMMVESEEFKAFMRRGANGSARLELKTAIVSDYDGGMSQALTPGDRRDILYHEPNRPLKIRDLLPKGRTTSNTVFFTKEGTFTSAAAVVVGGSPTVLADNVTKPEAALTFTTDSEVVATIAHWIPVSKQALDDSPLLASYINGRLMYGLKLKEETEILTGTGSLGTIRGINTDSTAYAQAYSPESYDDPLEILRDAKRQLQVANYEPSVVVLNAADWAKIELLREASNGQFIVGNPLSAAMFPLWGLQVVVSNSQAANTFTVFDPRVFMLVDREDASVRVSYEEGNNFIKNMVTILAEERMCLVNFSTSGSVKGTFPT